MSLHPAIGLLRRATNEKFPAPLLVKINELPVKVMLGLTLFKILKVYGLGLVMI